MRHRATLPRLSLQTPTSQVSILRQSELRLKAACIANPSLKEAFDISDSALAPKARRKIEFPDVKCSDYASTLVSE